MTEEPAEGRHGNLASIACHLDDVLGNLRERRLQHLLGQLGRPDRGQRSEPPVGVGLEAMPYGSVRADALGHDPLEKGRATAPRAQRPSSHPANPSDR